MSLRTSDWGLLGGVGTFSRSGLISPSDKGPSSSASLSPTLAPREALYQMDQPSVVGCAGVQRDTLAICGYSQ